jgi:4-diphosphocytidyl-2-C-methyl-D-erythritol kinase
VAASRRRLTVPAYAKINLHLDVGPRRDDGYHDLRTLFQEISLHDTLAFEPAPRHLSLTVSPPGLPTGPENLVIRALERLRTELKIKKGLRVHLTKRIPVGAGLGGGSSDAAAALLGGWALWKGRGRLPRRGKLPELLPRLARELGADVPFFLLGGTAWGEGIGERLTPVRRKEPKRWLVLVYPRVHVDTRSAYRLLDAARHKRPSTNGHQSAAGFLQPTNSFEAVILPRFTAVRNARAALQKARCKDVLMSGSGSSVFGFRTSRKDAERVAQRLRKKPWDVFVAHTR